MRKQRLRRVKQPEIKEKWILVFRAADSQPGPLSIVWAPVIPLSHLGKKYALGRTFCLHPAASLWAQLFPTISAPAGAPATGHLTLQLDCSSMGSLRCYVSPFGTSCQHSAFITQIEGPVYYILNPLSSPITLMWYHLSLLECRNKKGGVSAWQHLSECCKYLFEILD